MSEHEPEAAGTQAFLFAGLHVGHGIVVGIVDRGVLELFEFEAGAGIVETIHQHAFGADVRDADFQVGVEMAAPFDGVVQEFTKGIPDLFENFRGQIGFQAREKTLHAINDGAFAGNEKFDPVTIRGEYFDGGKRRTGGKGVFDGGEKGFGVEGLQEELVDTTSQSLHEGFGGLVRGHDNDFGNVRFALQAAEQAETGHLGHPDIEEDEVEAFFADQAEGGYAIGGGVNSMAGLPKDSAEHLASGDVVIRDEYV